MKLGYLEALNISDKEFLEPFPIILGDANYWSCWCTNITGFVTSERVAPASERSLDVEQQTEEDKSRLPTPNVRKP